MLTGVTVSQPDWHLYDWEDDSFLEQARLGTELGRMLSPHIFQAMFLAIIEARKCFEEFAAVHLVAHARIA